VSEKILAVAIAAAILMPVASFAQPSRSAGSPRCDSMHGAAKDQCVKDENAKAQSGATNPAIDAPIPGTSLGTPSTSAGSSAGSASGCDALSGTQKDDCLRGAPTTSSGADAAASGAGSADRAGPGSTGMGR
jgi:hypothetical protein